MSSTRPVVLAIGFVVLVGCGSSQQPPQPRPEPGDLTLETVSACAKGKRFDLVLVTGTTWRVRADSGEHAIDTQKQTCDDQAIAFVPGSSVIDVIAAAAKCVNGPPWNGLGAGQSPLDLQHPTIHAGDRVRVEYNEAEPKTKPPGAEVVVDGCRESPRE